MPADEHPGLPHGVLLHSVQLRTSTHTDLARIRGRDCQYACAREWPSPHSKPLLNKLCGVYPPGVEVALINGATCTTQS
jgi:hypothetical protein